MGLFYSVITVMRSVYFMRHKDNEYFPGNKCPVGSGNMLFTVFVTNVVRFFVSLRSFFRKI